MKQKTSIALMMTGAMLAGFAVAQGEAEAPAQQNQQAEVNQTPEQVKKNISLFLGYQNGLQLGSVPTLAADDLDLESYTQGVKEGMSGKQPTFDEKDVMASVQKFQETIDARIKESGAKNLEASKKFMEENAKQEGVKTTESGLQYKVVKQGEGKKIDEMGLKNPLVSIKYKGTKIDGTVFDEIKDEPLEMPLNFIPGFNEAIKMMPVGSIWTVYIPAELAYGENSPSSAIGPNEALIFELELAGAKEAPSNPMGGGGMQLSPEQLEALLKQSQSGEDGK